LWWFFGVFLRLLLMLILIFRDFFASGLAISIFAHTAINIGMNLGLLPVIGLPLPLVSYGGSNLLFTYISFGILQNIK